MFDWKNASRPIIALSPMADMTDTPFNLVCKEHGAPLIFKEMVSSEAIVRESEKTMRMTVTDDGERPLIQQIFGSDPTAMAKAAEIICEASHPDGIDINMGCPVYKIVSNFDGAALMKEPKRAGDIIRAVKSAVSVPVSVKTRLGWSDDMDCLDFAKVLEEAGADAIEVHGRTKAQAYSGTANWERVGEVKSRISIPLLLNGDIRSAEDAKRALAISNADGVLIGRGALGNPWIFEEILAMIENRPYTSPTMEERKATVLKHAELHLIRYGERGFIRLRKHLPFYFKGEFGNKDLRGALVRVETLEGLREILRSVD